MKTRAVSSEPMRRAVNWLYYLAGSAIYALSVDMFTAPNHLVPGGVTGVSTIINYLVPAFPIGIGIVVINLPLLFAAWRHLGRGFTLRTAAVTVMSSLILDAAAPFVPAYTGDPLLAALFGGVLGGVGIGLVFLRGATTGGSEIVARLMEKRWPHISIGRLILLVDGVVIAAAALVFGEIEAALYAVVLVFVSTAVMDELIGGSRRNRTVLIVCRRDQELADAVMHTMRRGVTKLDATGAYTGEPREMLVCVVRPSELYPLRLLVDETDPEAFMIVLTSDQVLGKGFQNIHPTD